jgi:hypothetical protein
MNAFRHCSANVDNTQSGVVDNGRSTFVFIEIGTKHWAFFTEVGNSLQRPRLMAIGNNRSILTALGAALFQ